MRWHQFCDAFGKTGVARRAVIPLWREKGEGEATREATCVRPAAQLVRLAQSAGGCQTDLFGLRFPERSRADGLDPEAGCILGPLANPYANGQPAL